MASPFAPVTAVDGTTSVGVSDAMVIHLDYRYQDYDYAAVYCGSLASSGSADSIKIQVSPDAPDQAGEGAGTWATYATQTCIAFQGTVAGPWKAIRVLKPGDQQAKVVFMTNGRNRKNQQQ